MAACKSLSPMLAFKKASEAIDFYVKAFGATEDYRLTGPDGSVGYAAIQVGDAHFSVADENPQFNCSPITVGNTTAILALEVGDPDAWVARATSAGATVIFPVKDQFYGHRAGRIRDPFGYVWIITKEIEKLSPAEMARRFEAMMKGFGDGKH
jgi:PhnB protein